MKNAKGSLKHHFFLVELFNFGGVLSLKMNGTHLHEGFENDVPLQMGEI